VTDMEAEAEPLAGGGYELLGVVLGGGRSRRFGSPKAHARVGGVPLAARSRDALTEVVGRVVLVAGDAELADALGLEDRPDRTPGLGPVGGVSTALHWARDGGLDGVLLLACDLPLVPSTLLRAIVDRFDGLSAIVPESLGPLGLEPLCAAYPVSCLTAVDDAARLPDRSMATLLAGLTVRPVPLADVSSLGLPSELFLNVNRPEDRERAERVLARREGAG